MCQVQSPCSKYQFFGKKPWELKSTTPYLLRLDFSKNNEGLICEAVVKDFLIQK